MAQYISHKTDTDIKWIVNNCDNVEVKKIKREEIKK